MTKPANDNDDGRLLVQLTAADLRALVRDEVARALGGKHGNDAAVETYVAPDALEAHFGISRGTVHNWVREGCPHEVRGKILRFKMSEVEAWFSGRGGLRRVR